jgi:hypothetical protein
MVRHRQHNRINVGARQQLTVIMVGLILLNNLCSFFQALRGARRL